MSVFAEEVSTDIHLAREKPAVLLDVLDDPSIDRLFYFDTDIVVTAPWDFFEDWVTSGVAAVCHNTALSEHHLHRKRWAALVESITHRPARRVVEYLNSGFLGLRREDLRLLEVWRDLIHAASELGVCLKSFQARPTRDPWKLTDQACLNAAVMATDVELSLLDAKAMDFAPFGDVMSHAAGRRKPWRRGFIRSALNGIPPQVTDFRWLAVADGPIEIYSRRELRRMRQELRVAEIIGRFYRHSMSRYYPP